MVTQYIYSIIAPIFNEEKVLKEFYRRLVSVMDKLQESYEIIFVNDGSTDKSMEIMETFYKEDKKIKIINFSRNFGHQIAITAGIDFALGEAVIILDADLQDPPEVIPSFIEKWKEGFEVVYGVREKRKGEVIHKKIIAAIFYRILNKMIEIKIPVDAGDFRLMDRKVVDSLIRIREKNRYLRGLTSWVGFNQVGVLYDREKRFAGYTKYPFKKSLRLAFDAIFSFTTLPLELASYFGFILAGCSFFYLFFVVILKSFTDYSLVSGWSALISAILFLGGVQLITLGIIGNYIGRISDETKNRPLYIVKNTIGKDK